MKTTTEVPTVDGFYWRKHELDDWYLVELRNGGRHCYYVGYDIALPIGGEASKGGVWSERLDNPHEEEVKDKKIFDLFMEDIWECPHEIGDGRPGIEPHPYEPHVYDVWEDDGKWLGDGGDEAFYEEMKAEVVEPEPSRTKYARPDFLHEDPYDDLDDDHNAEDDYPEVEVDETDWDCDSEPETVKVCQPTVVDGDNSFTVYVPGPYGWNKPLTLSQDDLTVIFMDFWRGSRFARTYPLPGDVVKGYGCTFIMGPGPGQYKWYKLCDTE